MEVLSQQQLNPILSREEEGKNRQAEAQTEREDKSISTRGEGKPWYNSRLINEEAVRWNEQEIKEEAQAESCSLIFRSGETLETWSGSKLSDSHLFP